jgi:aspartate kinase
MSQYDGRRATGSRRVRPGLLIHKYSVSVRDLRGMLNVCRRIKRSRDRGQKVVVVISALGQDTDKLAEFAYRMKGGMPRPPLRELDMLMASGESTAAPLVAIGLQGLGVPAVALSGLQAGIETDDGYGSAEITHVRPVRVLRALEDGVVAVVTGFQGATAHLDVTTLGRAGGDTTAVRLAAELGAEVCEIYTQVPGIMTADRHVVGDVAVVRHVTYEEALELAATGLLVSQPRAVEIAGQFGVPIHLRPVQTLDEGTMILGELSDSDRRSVTAVAHQDRIAKVRVTGVPNRPGSGADVLEPLRVYGISVEVIAHVATGDLAFMVRDHDLERAVEAITPAVRAVGGTVTHDADLAKISLVGIGARSRCGVAARMFRTLADARINIETIATSDVQITCIVEREGHERAVRALHSAFGLGRRRP